MRTPTSITPATATQIGRCGACGNCAASMSSPSQRICSGVRASRPASSRRPLRPIHEATLMLSARPDRAPAPSSAARRWSRPCRTGSSVPGIDSANGVAARSAASTQAVRRESLASTDSDAGSRDHASSTGPPPPAPSNSLLYQPAPRATAFHATRCGGSPRWNSRSPARSASSLGPRACSSAPPGPCGSRRRADLRRGKHDAREREVHVGPAAPEAERISREPASRVRARRGRARVRRARASR